jgi:hypothetical protein
MDVHHRTLLTNLKQDADVARNIGRFTNYSLFYSSVCIATTAKKMAMPAALVAGPPEAAGAILPAFMAPQGGGAIASMVSGLYGQSVDRFQDLARTDIGHMTQLYGDQEPTGTSMVFAHAMGVTTGPCAFLTVLPATPGNLPVVSVIHCVRQYIRPAADGTAATNNPLNNRTFAFMGDCFPPQLPTIMMDPSTGIIDYGQPTAMPVPNDVSLGTYYQGHGDKELAPQRTTTTQQAIRQVIYLPAAWLPSFIEDLPLKTAWERAYPSKYHGHGGSGHVPATS